MVDGCDPEIRTQYLIIYFRLVESLFKIATSQDCIFYVYGDMFWPFSSAHIQQLVLLLPSEFCVSGTK